MQSKHQMKEFVINLLKENLSKDLYYHNPQHTLYVLEKAMEIGRNEGCTEEELELIKAAALWHDTGYTKTYRNHEEESCNMARHYLPDYGYSADEIETIIGMIMATKLPQEPKNKLEEIMSDADLEYLGTASFETKADELFRELQIINPALTAEKWNHTQVSFLQKHHYFTRFCIENRNPVIQEYLKNQASGVS
jgi:predicted metal-dependent HD superfamily phosphohydrolase